MSENILSMKQLAEFDKMKEQKEKQLARQNAYNKNNYDRAGIVFKKGEKERIERHYKGMGFSSFNAYILHLVYTDMGESVPE